MFTQFILDKMQAFKEKDAFILNGKHYTYEEVYKKYDEALAVIKENNISHGEVVALEGDFSPIATAFLLALINTSCIIVPLTKALKEKKEEFIKISQATKVIILNDESVESVTSRTYTEEPHVLYNKLREIDHPGLILFSSGSTGASKGAVHDFAKILEKFKTERKTKRMITFLMFDHIGGVNTLFYNISNGGCVITIRDRSPENVLKVVEECKVQTLPVSPTFINLILLSEAYKKYDLSSLETVSYGTEVMPESTLIRFNSLFPNIRLLQTYGLSELGIMDTKSRSNDSLWVKLGGQGFQTRVVDNMLEIKADSAMLGYLNAASPFTEDGWFRTMDVVEVDGEYFKILGRKSEIINVGGEKVYPAEVESFFLGMEGLEDIAVKGEVNPIMGNIVAAKVKISTNETLKEFQKRMRKYAKDKLENYKIPQKIYIVESDAIHSVRLKKDRK